MKVITDAGTIDLGTTEAAPTIGIVDFSRRVTDDFGVTTVVERGFARRMSVRLVLPSDQVDSVQQQLAEMRATPARWIADERFEWLSFEGFYREFELDLALPPVSYCTLTVEGLTVSEPVADPGGDPAPDGRPSTLQLLRPVALTSAMLLSSNVPENDHPEWSAAVTYGLGAKVIKAAAHRVYESVAGGNVGNDPEGGSGLWVDIGPTNRWAMFDEALGTATSRSSSVAVTLDAGAVGAVALLDVVGATVRVQAPGYDKTVPVGPGAITLLDLPGVDDAVTITVAGSNVEIGTLLVGDVVPLGTTEANPSAGINDFSVKETDEFGDVTIVERAWSKRMRARAKIRTEAVDLVANRIAGVRAKPSLWIGNEGTDSLTIYGFFRDFSIEVGQTLSTLELSIEGLSKAPPPKPLAPINWTDIVDNDPVNRPRPDDGADVTGENTSRDTENVNGKPADQVISELDQLELDSAAHTSAIAAAEAQISDLFDTYGDTASAAASAAAALAHKNNAEIAANNAEQAEADAVAARDLAQAAVTAAEQAKTDAESAEADAIAAAGAAAGSASTAAGHASTATTKANEAAGSATAAAGSATTATTKAGEASVSAGQAASSATTAEGHKNAAASSATVAATSAGVAQMAAALQLPERYVTNDGSAFTSSVVLSPELSAPLAPNLNDPNYGWVYESSIANTQRDWAHRGVVPAAPGRIYEVEGEYQVTAASGGSAVYVFMRVLDAAYNSLPSLSVGQVPTSTGVHTLKLLVGAPDTSEAIKWASNASWLRAYIRADALGAGKSLAIRFRRLSVRDVTAREGAQASAAAAATSASTAATHATNAGTSASAAQTAATTATTKAGEASTSASQASASASDALGYRNTASTHASNAANSATAAGNSASAASGSASTASTHASNAGTSASSAQSAANTATTKAGEASTSASDAATSASNASGSATSASTSASVAATARDQAQLTAAQTLPERYISADDRSFSSTSTGNPSSVPVQAPNVTISGFGLGYETSVTVGGTSDWASIGVLPATAAQTYEVEVELDVIAVSGSANIGVFLRGMNANFASVDAPGVGFAITGTGRMVRSMRASSTASSGVLAWNASTVWLRPFTRLHGDGGSATVRFRRITVKEVSAQIAASAAATSASTATTKASEAATSASAASTSATTASTKAGEASTSAGQASTSATNASGSASTASTQASLAASSASAARLAGSSTYPDDPYQFPAMFIHGLLEDPETHPGLDQLAYVSRFTDSLGSGVTFTSSAGYTHVRPRSLVPNIAGRRWRLTVKIRRREFYNPSRSTQFIVRLYGSNAARTELFYNGHGTHYAVPGLPANVAPATTAYHTIGYDFVCNGEVAAWIVPSVYAITSEGGVLGGPNPQFDIQFYSLRDITSEWNAEQHSGSASVSASQAATHASNAAGSASTASTSATNAANSASNASGSASAASTSASTASTKAGEANTSALSAASSANTATTQAGNASASASNASSSASAANSSAAAATNSASLAATYATNTLMIGGNQYFDDGAQGWASTQGNADAKVPHASLTPTSSYQGASNVVTFPSSTQINMWSWKHFPVLAGRRYRVRAKFYLTGNAQMYVGIQAYGPSGPVGTNSGYHYMVVGGVVLGAGWHSLAGDFLADSLPAGATRVRLIAWSNYTALAASGGWDHFTIEDVTDVQELSATVSTQASTLATLNSQYASLNSTVSTQGVTITNHTSALATQAGNISTLFGRAGVRVDVNGRVIGWEINNNGTVGNMRVLADNFSIEKPGGGDGLTWTTDSSGRGTLRVKSGAVNVIELGWVP